MATISTWSCDTTANGFTPQSAYVLDQNGGQLTEMSYFVNPATGAGAWQWAHTNVEAGGLSATYDADPTGKTAGPLYFHLSDWLGTRRQQTDYAGNPVLNFTGLPFGDGLGTIPVSNTDAADATEHHFTGKERDTESGNDYFGARYYASSMGRFMSPDWADKPETVPYADLTNPQTLNLYSYGRNNPLTVTDPDGHCTSGGAQKGFWWCLFHYSDQDAIYEAKNYFTNNTVFQNGKRLDPSKMTDQQLLDSWKSFNDQWKAIAATGANPAGVMAAGAVQLGLFPDVDKIVNGHSWQKHQGEFSGWSQSDFKQAVDETVQNPDEVKQLSNGRTAYWNDKEKMVVIHDPSSPDGGTAFRPTNGKAYFDNSLK